VLPGMRANIASGSNAIGHLIPKVRVYLACSLDGFIAGPDNDLSWLAPPDPAPTGPTEALEFGEFMAQVGVMLMGRVTHDTVAAMGEWPYGEMPVLVATRRPLQPGAPSVRAVQGDIAELLAEACQTAGDKDVYLDGGALVRQALAANLVDELVLTWVPIVLGDGVSLFKGLERQNFEFVAQHSYHYMTQVTLRPRASPSA
jgi:dihydrofolate reductase